MHPTANISPGSNPRSGIALIVVLGFLAVLIIMGVAFAIVMRTERMAARAFADVARARQMTQVGLARALSDIDGQMNASGVVYPEFTTPNFPDVLVSSGTGTTEEGIDDTLGARGFLPLATWSPVAAGFPVPRYTEVKDPGRPGNPVIGQYAYIAINCSGLLDANYVGGLSRGVGTNAAEIQLTTALLPELTLSGTTNLANMRNTTFKRFESVPDLLAVSRTNSKVSANIIPTDDKYIYWPSYNPPAAYANGLNNTSNLFVYSRVPQGWLNGGTVVPPVYIGGDKASLLTNEAAIKAELSAMAIPDVDTFFLNLVDYVDEDTIPGNGKGALNNVNNMCTESVPMLSEIVVSNWYEVVGPPDTYTNKFQLHFELYYPFGVDNAKTYSIRYRAIYEGFGANYDTTTKVLPLPAGAWTPGRLVAVASDFFSPPPVTIDPMTGTPPAKGSFQVRIRAEVLENGATVVDQMGVSPNTVRINIGGQMGGALPLTVSAGKAAIDPRINWDGTSAAQWTNVTGVAGPLRISLAETNPVSIDAFSAPAADKEATCYVANTNLQATGELGLLLFDSAKPWQTISLLSGANFYPVLDRFTVFTERVLKGVVNLNTPQRAVLQSVLTGVRPERYPGDTTAVTLPAIQTLDLANKIIAAGPYVNRSDVRNAATIGGFSPMKSEGVLRNSMDLLYTRQQIFTIMVVGRHIDALGNKAAERKLVAVVWRDPFPNASGKHENFVRFFKWLDVLE